MERFNAPLSIKVIYVLNEVIFWIFNLATVLALVLAILVFIGLFGDDMQLHVNLPLAFNSDEIGFLMVNNTPTEVQLVNSYGEIHLIDTPLYLSRIFMVPLLIVIAGMYFLLYTFRRFIRNVRNGIIFEINNIRLLRILSIGLICFWLFTVLYDFVFGIIMLNRLHFGTIILERETKSHASLLIFSLVLWVLSHIFLQGLKLDEESKLTI